MPGPPVAETQTHTRPSDISQVRPVEQGASASRDPPRTEQNDSGKVEFKRVFIGSPDAQVRPPVPFFIVGDKRIYSPDYGIPSHTPPKKDRLPPDGVSGSPDEHHKHPNKKHRKTREKDYRDHLIWMYYLNLYNAFGRSNEGIPVQVFPTAKTIRKGSFPSPDPPERRPIEHSEIEKVRNKEVVVWSSNKE